MGHSRSRAPANYVHTTERQGNMQLSTPLSLLVHSSKHCVYKRSGAKKARVQRRSGPACTDDPNSACTDDALTRKLTEPERSQLLGRRRVFQYICVCVFVEGTSLDGFKGKPPGKATHFLGYAYMTHSLRVLKLAVKVPIACNIVSQ